MRVLVSIFKFHLNFILVSLFSVCDSVDEVRNTAGWVLTLTLCALMPSNASLAIVIVSMTSAPHISTANSMYSSFIIFKQQCLKCMCLLKLDGIRFYARVLTSYSIRDDRRMRHRTKHICIRIYREKRKKSARGRKRAREREWSKEKSAALFNNNKSISINTQEASYI